MSRNYSIKAVSNLTGITAETLRVWERRHHAVVPKREGKNRRVYTDEEVARLTLLKKANDLGHPIRMIASLSIGELEQLAAEKPSHLGEVAHFDSEALVANMIANLKANEIEEFERQLSWSALSTPPWRYCEHVLFPLLQQVGQQWYEGNLSVALEHTVSARLRDMIGAMVRLYPRHTRRRELILATLPGENHEFGILLASLLAAVEGIGSRYLGPNLPPEEIARTALETEGSIVALSTVFVQSPEAFLKDVDRLSSEIGSKSEIWIGGAWVHLLENELEERGLVVFKDLSRYKTYLEMVREKAMRM